MIEFDGYQVNGTCCRVQTISRVFGENHVLIFRKTIMQTDLVLISVHEDQYMALYQRAESLGEF